MAHYVYSIVRYTNVPLVDIFHHIDILLQTAAEEHLCFAFTRPRIYLGAFWNCLKWPSQGSNHRDVFCTNINIILGHFQLFLHRTATTNIYMGTYMVFKLQGFIIQQYSCQWWPIERVYKSSNNTQSLEWTILSL